MLSGKVAIVTGAAGALGKAIASQFVAAGAAVVAADMDISAFDGALHEGGRVLPVKHDVTSERDWGNTVRAAADQFGGLDILVNCAGALTVEPIETLSYEEWRRVMAVNCDGAFLGIKAALPELRKRAKQNGLGTTSIINIASAQGLKAGLPGMSAYVASKGALRLLTRNAAVEFGRLGYGIRCNAIVPSAMGGTAMMAKVIELQVERGVFATAEQGHAALIAVHPLGKTGEPIDVAHAAVFLASDYAKHITGIDLPVDGGVCA